jgi:outer membrane biosynthesis protein TonB
MAPGAAALSAGGAAGADFFAPDEDTPDGVQPLFAHEGGAFLAHVRGEWDGFLQDARGARTPLEAGGTGRAPVEVPEGATLWIDTGHVVFAARHVPPGRRAPVTMRDRVDYPFLGITGFVGFAAAMLGLVIATAPPPVETQAMDAVPERIAMVLQVPPPAPLPVEKPKPEVSNQEEGGKAKRKEGRAGKRESKMRETRGSRAAMNRMQRDRELANDAGLLGAMQDEGVAALMGDGALQSGMFDAIGSKYAGARGDRIGTGGLGDRGDGLGGGGDVAGIGGTGTRGKAGGDGRYGAEGGNWGAKKSGAVKNLSGEILSLGSLDAALIDEVVKRHASAIRYCYQRELTKDPSLEGKVVVKFTIAGDGSVSKAGIKRSSLGSAAAESCISKRFHTMRFPEPKGNGIVIVSYPFLFSAG